MGKRKREAEIQRDKGTLSLSTCILSRQTSCDSLERAAVQQIQRPQSLARTPKITGFTLRCSAAGTKCLILEREFLSVSRDPVCAQLALSPFLQWD